MPTKRIFISGKITGEPISECAGKFDEAYEFIAFWGGVRVEFKPNNVINPLDMPGIHFGISHAEAMEICLRELKNCTHIYMLRNWKDSPGAIQEHEFAKANNIEIIYEI